MSAAPEIGQAGPEELRSPNPIHSLERASPIKLHTIRDAVSDDQGGVIALWRTCGLVADYNDPAADFQFAMTRPASAVLVAEDAESRLIGSIMVGHDGHRGWLYYVAAAPSARGSGVGRALLDAAEDWLKVHGVRKVQLMVRASNAQVVSFYEHLGYEETPRIVMAKWLP